jgi:hypothetical protein
VKKARQHLDNMLPPIKCRRGLQMTDIIHKIEIVNTMCAELSWFYLQPLIAFNDIIKGIFYKVFQCFCPEFHPTYMTYRTYD